MDEESEVLDVSSSSSLESIGINANTSDVVIVQRPEENSDEPGPQKRGIILRALGAITLEPMLFLQMFASNLIPVITQNLYIDRICRITLNKSEELCRPFSHANSGEKDPDLETEIQIQVSTLMIYENIIEFTPVIIFALFLGTWSDKHGSKIPMILSIFGFFVSTLIFATVAYFKELRPEFLYLAFIPLGLTGGMMAISVSAYSYMARMTNIDNRSFRIHAMQVIWLLGQPAGTYSGAKLYATADFVWVYIVSAGLYSLSWIYGLLFVREDEIPRNTDSATFCSEAITFSAVKNTLTVIFKRREGSKRKWLLLLWFLFILRTTITTSGGNLTYLFVRKQIDFDEQSFSDYQTITMIMNAVGNYTVTFLLLKVFKVRDPVIGLLSGIEFLLASLVFAFATKGWTMYLGSAIQMFAGLQTMSIRSLLSKCVEKDETSKMFSFIALTEVTLQFSMGALVNILYNVTVDTLPGAFYFMQTLLNAIMITIFTYFVFRGRGLDTKSD